MEHKLLTDLIDASKNRTQWVLPKGHIESGEGPRETAVREVKEETGYWARVVHWIENLNLGSAPDHAVARFYLMEAAEDGERAKKSKSRPAENRQHQWLVLAEAKQKASFEETRSLLETAETLRVKEEETKMS